MSDELQRNQPCGCIICVCEDNEQCHGCGAKHCGTHPIGEIPNPAYIPMIHHALTREQAEQAFLGLYQEQHIKGNLGVTTTLILLQAHIAQQAQEMERMKAELAAREASYDRMRDNWSTARQDAARYKAALESIAKPALGGKEQQWKAQAALKEA